MLAFLLLAAAPQTALDAERAFDAAAGHGGQWTAFRAFAAPDAVMFVPQNVPAQAWLQARKDPAAAVRWQATASFVSCDGAVAVNTGPYRDPDGSIGYFTTIWARQADGGWKWLLDSGDALCTPRPAPPQPAVDRAACKGAPVEVQRLAIPAGQGGYGASPDGTLSWYYRMLPGGGHKLAVDLWNGRHLTPVIADEVGR